MKTKEQLLAMITKRNAPLIKQCILILETMPKEYILKEKKQVLFDIHLMETRGKEFYMGELKDLRRKLKYLRFITAKTYGKRTNLRRKL